MISGRDPAAGDTFARFAFSTQGPEAMTKEYIPEGERATPAGRTIDSLIIAAVLTLLIGLFHFLGSASNVEMDSRSIFAWLGSQWAAAGGDFSHGWLMPLISLWIVWHKRHELAAARTRVDPAGLVWTGLFLLLHIAAYRAQQPRLSSVAFVGLTWALPYYFFGREVAGKLLFPCAYLLLCVTSYLLTYFTFQLRLTAGMVAAWMLNGVGIAAQRSGTAIFSEAGGGFAFDVADPCSGLRSLMVMSALAAPYAWWTQKTQPKKWMLFAASIPLAMIANIVRIVTIAIVAEHFGRHVALKLYHDFSGYLLFTVAIFLLMGTSTLLNLNYRERLRTWLKNASKPA